MSASALGNCCSLVGNIAGEPLQISCTVSVVLESLQGQLCHSLLMPLCQRLLSGRSQKSCMEDDLNAVALM